MAERRMFTNKITEADEFTSLPPTTQALYFHLCMNCDDDGFSNQIRTAMFNAHATTDDMNMLVSKRFVIPFESGVVVIKHWKMHNIIRSDRYHETQYLEEKAKLLLKDNGVYTEADGTHCIQDDNQVTTKCLPNDNQMETEVSIGKVSIGKVREGKVSIGKVKATPSHTVYFPDDALLEKTFHDFMEMRKKIKKPMTDRAIELMIGKIQKYPPEHAVELLEDSILHGWQDIYPHKEAAGKSGQRDMMREIWGDDYEGLMRGDVPT